MKDHKGNTRTNHIFSAVSHLSEEDRELYDFYATPPKATELLLNKEKLFNPWECACGQGHISKVVEAKGYQIRSTDFVDRGYGTGGIDFLGIDNIDWMGDIITNPPYKYAHQFILKALNIIPEGCKVIMFLKIQFLEGIKKRDFFRNFPPLRIYVSSDRLTCAKNGDFKAVERGAVCYAWYIWEKGYKGDTIIKKVIKVILL